MLFLSISKKTGGSGDRSKNSPLGNGGHYPHRSGGGCGGAHGTPAGSGGGPPDDPYGSSLDSSLQ